MEPLNIQLKQRYRFTEYLYYLAQLLIPGIAALAAILEKSPWGAVGYGIVIVLSVAAGLRFFCSRCPHYTRDDRLLDCIFFWHTPKVFKPRPGKLTPMDILACTAASVLLIGYPVYWLIQEPWLLIIYCLSLAVLAASIRRNECHRCIYSQCPFNRVSEAGRF